MRFVTRNGSRLELDGQPFRFSGANIYWLGLDENVGGVDYPTAFRIRDAFDAARSLGVTVVRSHMMTSTSQAGANSLALMLELGAYNQWAFATIDQAVVYAAECGIRLILPLTDEWSYYHGGHRDFVEPLGLDSADFYRDPTVVAAFRDYVREVVTHTNTLTGVPFNEDPTILAWELGNELEGMTPEWIEEQATFIKSLAPQHLVAAGRRFGVSDDAVEAPTIDIVDAHYYPPTVEQVTADARRVTEHGKVYIVGEYGSISASDALLQPLAEDPNVAGMLFWSLFARDDDGAFVEHDDGFTLHVPGDTPAMRENVAAIRRYSQRVAEAAS